MPEAESVTTRRGGPRDGAFWLGAAPTIAVSLILLVVVSWRDGGLPNWLALVTICGTVLAYAIAWVGGRNPYVHGLALLLFLGAIAPAILGSVALMYLPGLLGLVFGTTERAGRRRRQRATDTIGSSRLEQEHSQ